MASDHLGPRNPRIGHLRRLVRSRRARHDEGCLVAEGPKLVVEAVATGRTIEVFCAADHLGDPRYAEPVARAQAAGIPVWTVAPGALERVADAVTPQPVMAVVGIAPHLPHVLPDVLPDVPSHVPATGPDGADGPMAGTPAPGALVLASVADPGNVGTLVRSAEAAGLTEVWVCGQSADPHSPKAVRASAGSILRVPVHVRTDVTTTLEELRHVGWHLVATAAGAPCIDDVVLPPGTAMVLGSEAHGLDPAVLAGINVRVSIPMAGEVESLNVAVAGSLLAFEFARRHRRPGATGMPGA